MSAILMFSTLCFQRLNSQFWGMFVVMTCKTYRTEGKNFFNTHFWAAYDRTPSFVTRLKFFWFQSVTQELCGVHPGFQFAPHYRVPKFHPRCPLYLPPARKLIAAGHFSRSFIAKNVWYNLQTILRCC